MQSDKHVFDPFSSKNVDESHLVQKVILEHYIQPVILATYVELQSTHYLFELSIHTLGSVVKMPKLYYFY